MNVEIIEFYPLERDEQKAWLDGTIRVKLPDFGLNILGIYSRREKGRWYFTLPERTDARRATGERISYPFVAFEDKDQQRALFKAIRQQAPAFIEKRIVDTERPIIWPQNSKRERQPQKQKATSPMGKEAKPVKAVECRDPPTRKPIVARNTSKYKNVTSKT